MTVSLRRASFITSAFVRESRDYENEKAEKGGRSTNPDGITSPVKINTRLSRHVEINLPVSNSDRHVTRRGRVFGRGLSVDTTKCTPHTRRAVS